MSRIRLPLRRSLIVLPAIAAVAGTAGSAVAYFSADAGGPASARAGSLSAPTAATATANGASQITVGWTPPASQLAGAQHRVTRTSGPGSPVTVCTVAANVSSCADAGLAGSTTYGYSVIAFLASWQSSASTASATTAAAVAADGSGTLTTPTTAVVVGTTGNTLTFTYTAATGGMSNGSVTLAVPTGWSAPSTTGSAAGFTTASTGTVSTTGQTITVSGVTLSSGATMTVVYGSKASGGPGATAPTSTGTQTWQAKQASSAAGTLTNLATSPSISVNANLAITSVVRDGGSRKYQFTGTGGTGTSAVTVTICTVNTFPCPSGSIAGTAVTPAASTTSWTTGQDNNNLGNDVQYFAQATQGTAASASFRFVSTSATPAVIPGGVVLANGSGSTLGRADANDTVTITFGEAMHAPSFCSTWSNGSVQTSSASVQIVNNSSNDTLTNLTVSGCTFNLGSVALNANYVSSTVTFGSSTVSWDPGTGRLTITLGGGTGQNTSIAAAVPSYTASTAITDQAADAIAAGPWGGTSSRF